MSQAKSASLFSGRANLPSGKRPHLALMQQPWGMPVLSVARADKRAELDFALKQNLTLDVRTRYARKRSKSRADLRSEAVQNGENEPKLPVSAENIALKCLYGLLTEALGNLSLPCASRAAWPSAAGATPSPVSVRRFSFSRTVLLLERFQPVRWRLAASDKRARPQATPRRHRKISLRSRRDPRKALVQ